jgi:hypothetical protein
VTLSDWFLVRQLLSPCASDCLFRSYPILLLPRRVPVVKASLSTCLPVYLFACSLLVTCLSPHIGKSPVLPRDRQACLQIFPGFAYLNPKKPSIAETLTSLVADFFHFCLPLPPSLFCALPGPTRSGQPCGVLHTLLTIVVTCDMFRCRKGTN